ncbi:protein translocase subunit SecF [Sphingosinicella sp. YJ22]|uniref:protein translocase subunit SecF n=1 Tax=Sphingosinicella sp. YJ22 TaxID=1104780 RepID=UPI0014086AB6|nr:protein translocase subunit SecF [Sphingosinicella sp. YJ22]
MPLLKLVPDNTNIDFLRWRNFAIVVSLVLIAASVFFLVTRGLNLGVDFVGGQMIRTTFQEPPALDELRERVSALNVGDPAIQEFGSPREIAIRLPLAEGETEAQADAVATQVRNALTAAYPGVRIDAVETVSGKVSEELFTAGGLALLIAMLGIAAYIWIRFEWQFGVGALVSLVHDLTIVLGFYAATQVEFSLNAVAALLTLIGFSLNDTVVVYDRIRENLRKYRKMEIEPLLNLSVNETLSRTIGTNTAVMLAILSLLIFGPDVIYDLTIGIFVGVIIGTYSSIYVARFMLVPLGVSGDSFVPKTGPAGAERVGPRPGKDGDGAQV